jgi:hypothetical protein
VEHEKIRGRLSAYKDNELEKNLRDQITWHLQDCEACREELRALDVIDNLIVNLPPLSVSDSFAPQIIARALPAQNRPFFSGNLLNRILEKFLRFADSMFELLPLHEFQKTGSLDEFGDFPPLSLSHAYFQLMGLPR